MVFWVEDIVMNVSPRLGEITIAELVDLQKRLEHATLREGIQIIKQVRENKVLSEQEAMALGRMAVAFRYDAPREYRHG